MVAVGRGGEALGGEGDDSLLTMEVSYGGEAQSAYTFLYSGGRSVWRSPIGSRALLLLVLSGRRSRLAGRRPPVFCRILPPASARRCRT